MTEATPTIIRQRIERVPDPRARLTLQATFLWCARVSEVVSRASPSDRGTTARGPRGTACARQEYVAGDVRADAAVFQLTSSHGSGRPRACALPLDVHFEPWTPGLFSYFSQVGDRPAFPFTRQLVGQWARDAFAGLTYPIEKYSVPTGKMLNGKPEREEIDRHPRDVGVHALRHLRALELVVEYGFTPMELAAYGGWTLGGGGALGTNVLSRYVQLDWRSYFPKLLKRRNLALVR